MSKPNRRYKLHVLCWSHLDREWDFPFEAARQELVEVVEAIAALLEKNPRRVVYHLDGQVVPLEDYLAVKPEARARLQRLTRSRRLLIGPWYTLPEMNVIAGECIARNFLMARKVAGPFGGVMNAGLSNTGWGQISQMPQILQNFGISTYTSYRGVPVDAIERECLWEGSDGSRVMLIRPSPGPRSIFFAKLMVPAHRYLRWSEPSVAGKEPPIPGVRMAGSDSGTREPYFADYDERLELEHVVRRVPEIIKTLAPDATTPDLWLGYWQDAIQPHPRLMEVVDEVQRHLPEGSTIAVSSLPAYVAALARRRRNLTVQIRGEMRTPRKGENGADLLNVLSSRTGLKVANRKAEITLIHGADMWSAVAASLGMPYPGAALDRAWKLLLTNQCHDTIGGVGVDRVHEDQVGRYAKIADLAGVAQRKAVAHLVRRTGFTPRQPGESGLTVFNPLPFERNAVVECSVDVPVAAAAEGVRLVDAQGREAQVELISSRRLHAKFYNPRSRYSMQEVCRHRVRFNARTLPPCGWATYSVLPGKAQRPGRVMKAGSNWMQNECLRVRFLPDGSYELRSLQNGRVFKPCGIHEDTGNEGHGWAYRAPESDTRITSAGVPATIRKLVHTSLQTTFVVDSVLRVPESLTADRAARSPKRTPIPIRSEITLLAGSPVLRVKTTVRNTVRDHRLRVLFPTVEGASHSWAETPYDVVRRDIRIPDSTGWIEPWQGTQPMLNFADVSDGKAGFAVIPLGLCEYEVLDDRTRTLAVTLLRGFTYRHPYHSNAFAPEESGSQCLGEQTVEYAVYPHAGDWERGHVSGVARDTLVPVLPVQHFGTTASGARRASVLRIGSDRLVLHALKRAEDGQGLIVRLGNPTNRPVSASLQCLLDVREAVLCNMAEEPLGPLSVRDRRRVRVHAGPRQVVTVRLVTGRD